MLLIYILLFFTVFVETQAQILFPAPFVLQLTTGVAVPTTVQNRNIVLNLCMQANYNAISNVSQLNPTVIQAKSSYDFGRKTLYTYISNTLNNYVVTGEECLKRLICETAASSIQTSHRNSLLEKILLYIVTPSKDAFSRNDSEMIMFHEAESKGKLKQNCITEYKNCQISLLDLFTT